jgi:hypothetical protein
MAPPPPILTTEGVEWLAPEPEGDDSLVVVFEDPEPFEVEEEAPRAGVSNERGLVIRAWATLRGLVVRG